MASKRKISYFYDSDIGNYYYGPGHPMKPHRVRMAHMLVLHYGLYKSMKCLAPVPADAVDMTRFHKKEYIDFLSKASPDGEHRSERRQFNLAGDDCPVFDGLWPYCRSYVGATLGGAVELNSGAADIVVNWSGGLHHAHKAEASGFCYVNDIVLGILELLRYHRRVLYIDIDLHHGDGVEEAFYTTDRVMTVSFHKYGDFFPGTGDIDEVGEGKGRGYSLNVPLSDGITDEAYVWLFKTVMKKVVEVFDPEAIVFQAGADSLVGDKLGCFNLTTRGHGECLKFMRSFNLPMQVLGGGGYTIRNVARCWAYETAIAVGQEDQVGPQVPSHAFFEYYGPDYELHVRPDPGRKDENDREVLDKVVARVLERLSRLGGPPSTELKERPESLINDEVEVRPKKEDPDQRPSILGMAQGARGPGEVHLDDYEGPEEKPSRHRDDGSTAEAPGTSRGGSGEAGAGVVNGRGEQGGHGAEGGQKAEGEGLGPRGSGAEPPEPLPGVGPSQDGNPGEGQPTRVSVVGSASPAEEDVEMADGAEGGADAQGDSRGKGGEGNA